MKNRMISLFLFVVMIASISACNAKTIGSSSNYTYEKETDNLLKFSSSDKEFDKFINDYFRRNVGATAEENVYQQELGQSSFFAKEWESMALSWFDNSKTAFANDRSNYLKGWLSNITQDKFGYVWSGIEQLETPTEDKAGQMFMQGWPFPFYGNPGPSIKCGWSFNSDIGGWTTSVPSKLAQGFLTTKFENENEITFTSPYMGVSPYYMPFIELDLSLIDNNSFGVDSNIEDIYVQWQFKDSKTTYIASQKELNTRPINPIPANLRQRMYLAMYQNENWGKSADKEISNIKLIIKAKPNKKINGEISLNYLRCNYDSRQINNAELLITSANNMLKYSQDKEYIKAILPKLRKAMSFYLNCAYDENGSLIDLSKFFVGHDSLVMPGHGIGNGYWDIQVEDNINFYSNLYFYRALKAMESIESLAADYNIEAEMPSVYGADNKTVFKYNQTAQSLGAIAEKLRKSIQRNFWNEETGRFCLALGTANEKLDYGWTTYNLEAVASDVATPEQAKSIMDWITGKRIVETDTAKGADIYKWEFAPVINTLDNQDKLYWPWDPLPYGVQLQNGGAVLFMSYYDLVARAKVYGIDNMYDRFKQIQKWYDKVAKAGGTGQRFYYEYYSNLAEPIVLEGWSGGGQIGIDTVFMESSILYSVIPDSIYNLNVIDDKTVQITPEMPANLTFFKLENLKFKDIKFDLSVGKSFVQINSVRGKVENEKIEVIMNKPKGTFKVYYNGALFKDYRIEKDKIIAKIPLSSGKIYLDK